MGGFLVVQKHVTTCYNVPVESDLRVPALAMQSGLDMVATHVTNFGYFAINSWHVIVSYMMLHGLYIMICGYDCDLQQVLNFVKQAFWIFLGDHHTWRFVATVKIDPQSSHLLRWKKYICLAVTALYYTI